MWEAKVADGSHLLVSLMHDTGPVVQVSSSAKQIKLFIYWQKETDKLSAQPLLNYHWPYWRLSV